MQTETVCYLTGVQAVMIRELNQRAADDKTIVK